MPQFDITTFSSQLFWLSFIFTVLYFIISKYIAPKIEFAINSRDKYIESNINYAQEYNDKIKSIEVYKEEILHEVDQQINQMQNIALNSFNDQYIKTQELLSTKIGQKQQKSKTDIQKYIAICKLQSALNLMQDQEILSINRRQLD